jgi:hypothetical protein
MRGSSGADGHLELGPKARRAGLGLEQQHAQPIEALRRADDEVPAP